MVSASDTCPWPSDGRATSTRRCGPRSRPGNSSAARSGQACEAEVTVSLAAAYLALGRQEDALAVLDAMPVDEQIRPQTRVHSLVLRAMAASAAAPSAAAAFLLSHASEFAGGSDEQTMLLIRATQEIAYRSAAYENAALLLGVADETGLRHPGR